MIENIISLTDDFSMRLLNPAAKLIYKVDSINLIIGDNGTGKTKTIKSIIKELIEPSQPPQFTIDGALDELGIVYYTAAPFHKKPNNVNNKRVTFIDASPPRPIINETATAAREYQRVAESLNIPNPLLSVKDYDFRDFAFRCVRRLDRPMLSPRLVTLQDEFQALSRQRSTFIAQQKKMEEKQEALLAEIARNRTETIESIIKNHANAVNELLVEKRYNSDLLAQLKEKLIDQFLAEAGPKNEKWAIIWLAAMSNHVVGPGSSGTLQMARLLYQKDESLIPTGRKWQTFFDVVKKFLKVLKTTRTGSFDWTPERATITTDILRLLETPDGEKSFENAHAIKIVAFGFESVSSGEAAILNQLTSITNSVYEIKKSGKKKILIFIDEGDILLHLKWQRRYLHLLDERLGYLRTSEGLTSLQVVVATHSPLIASDALRGSITRMKNVEVLPAFGAPIQSIINCSFDTPSIGEIAEREISRLQQTAKYLPNDLLLIEEIDDDFVRQYLKKLK